MTDQLFWINLVVWIVVVYWQPSFGSFRANSGEQYNASNRGVSLLRPPSWIFGIVWPIIYALMAWAIIIYVDQPEQTTMILILVNLLLNKLWTPLFFGLNQRILAFIVLLAIVVTNVWIQVEFCTQKETTSFYLWLPYTIWTFYALILNGVRAFGKRTRKVKNKQCFVN